MPARSDDLTADATAGPGAAPAAGPRAGPAASLTTEVLRALRSHQMCQPGETLVVGVSGGPDSLALLLALRSLDRELGVRLHVAHLDHMLRGEESAADARYVAELAARLALPATVGARDVPALRAARRLGVEEAARLARYEFFAEVVAATGASGVAVAHTADDQVETVVLHFLRGTGLAGLRGMRPVTLLRVGSGEARPLRVCRPLLAVSRAEVEAFCRAAGASPRRDPSNVAAAHLRNRLREEVLPQLRRQNPRLGEAVLRLARLAGEDDDYLQAEAARVWPSAAVERASGVGLRLDACRRLAPALQARLLREAYARLAGDLAGLEAAHVEAARRLLVGGATGAAASWPQRVRVEVGYGELVVTRESPPAALPEAGRPLAVPGLTALPEAGEALLARLVERPCDWVRGDVRHADVDLDRAGRELVVRRRRPGDRLVPLGSRGTRKLQDVLVDARVPRGARDLVPVVARPDAIVWVAGVRLDERFKVTAATRQVLCLRQLAAAEREAAAGRAAQEGEA